MDRSGVPGEHPHLPPCGEQPRDQLSADVAAGAGDQGELRRLRRVAVGGVSERVGTWRA